MDKNERNKMAAKAIEDAINSIENGIIVEHHDSLNMDAFNVRVRKDGKDVPFTEDYRYPYYTDKDRSIKTVPLEKETNTLRVIMVGDSEYYRSVGLKSTVRILLEKHYNLPVYFLDLGWYTFPCEYRPVKESWLDCLPAYITKDENGDNLAVQQWIPVIKSMLHVDFNMPEEEEQ